MEEEIGGEEWGKATASCIPFIAKTFSHACPTRAPGDQTRMHSVLSTFFNGPVSGEEKKRRMKVRVQGVFSFFTFFLNVVVDVVG